MPFQLTYERAGTGVVIKASGVVSADDVLKINDQMYTADRFHRLRYQLCDCRDVTELEISSADLRIIAGQDCVAAAGNPNLAIAIVGNQDAIYGMGRMWEVFVSDAPLKSRVFRSIESARAWLERCLKQIPESDTRVQD